jgi:hypothetical protein
MTTSVTVADVRFQREAELGDSGGMNVRLAKTGCCQGDCIVGHVGGEDVWNCGTE